jgi:hypothetical protein
MRVCSIVPVLVAVLAGCGPSSLQVLDYKAFSDDKLIEYAQQLAVDIEKERVGLEAASASGRPGVTGVRRGNYDYLRKRQAEVHVEIRRRGLSVPGPQEPAP